MQRILAAVDGSPAALKAVAFAAELAGERGAELILATVLSEPAPEHAAGLEDYARLEHIEAAKPALPFTAADALLDEARRAAQAKGARRIAVETALGDPAEEIVALAKRQKADLIVVGSRGRSRIAGLLLGSVADHVTRAAPCPVTIVR